MKNQKSNKSSMVHIVFLLGTIGLSSHVFSEEELIRLPGSDEAYTEKRINDFFNVPDWYPNDHIEMPAVVRFGAKPAVFACASCHLVSGSGHPESSSLAALPVDYQVRQMKAYQKFQRPSVVGVMTTIAQAMNDEQIQASAEYFAALPALNVQKVVESETVPVSYVNSRFMRLVVKDGGTEPIGERLITLPVDENRVKARDPYGTFVAYVPPGSLALGKDIVSNGKNNVAPCTSCHGPQLKGTEIAPIIAGQHASYLLTQLRDYKMGIRRGEADPGAVMATNMKYFKDSELIAIAGYIASLPRQ